MVSLMIGTLEQKIVPTGSAAGTVKNITSQSE